MSKIIFLDCDGVLNSLTYVKANQPMTCVGAPSWRQAWIDPTAMATLNKIIELTGADIVISSTWRIGAKLSELREDFIAKGFVGNIIGKTPNLSEKDNRRGKEIDNWIKVHNFTGKFAIIDDDSDLEPYMDHFVKTTWYRGLLEEHIKLVVEKLDG